MKSRYIETEVLLFNPSVILYNRVAYGVCDGATG